MKRPGKKVATDRSFVVALSRGLDVLRAFHPNDGLLGNQEIAARTNLPKPTISRLTYTLTKLGYLTPVPRFEKYQLAPSAMSLGYAALANLGVRHCPRPTGKRSCAMASNVPARPWHVMDSRSRPANGRGFSFAGNGWITDISCSLSWRT